MSKQKKEEETKKQSSPAQSKAKPQAKKEQSASDSKSPEPQKPLESLEKKSKTGSHSSSTMTMRLKGHAIKTSLDFNFLKQKHPDFSVGDTVRVNVQIREGDKQRIQVYEGIVIALRGEGNGRSFIVRRLSHEVGVERIFPYYSPAIQSIEIVRKGRVRRARLYYLRHKSGKGGRIQESFAHIAGQRKEEELETEVEEVVEPSEAKEAEAVMGDKKIAKKIMKKEAKKVSRSGPRKIIKVSKTAAKKMVKKTASAADKKTAKQGSKKAMSKKATGEKKD